MSALLVGYSGSQQLGVGSGAGRGPARDVEADGAVPGRLQGVDQRGAKPAADWVVPCTSTMSDTPRRSALESSQAGSRSASGRCFN